MKLIIDIDDELVETAKFAVQLDMGDDYVKSIANGTPLPKGHGDLIDRKELLKQPMDKANYPSNYVRIAPTIIKADKAEKE